MPVVTLAAVSAEEHRPGRAGEPEPGRPGTSARETTSLAIADRRSPIAVGLGVGLATDDVGLWLPIGVALGVTGVFASRWPPRRRPGQNRS